MGAAAMALRLVKLTGWKATWIFIAGAISLMAVRRGITLVRVITVDEALRPDLQAELVALTISVLMVVGIAYLAPVIESIRRAEREVRQLIEASPEATVVVDEQDKIVLANTQAGRLFGYFPHQLRGKPVQLLMPERFVERHRIRREQFLRDPRRASFAVDAGLFGLHADGHEFPVQISVNPLETASGSRVVASIQDMSEYQEAQAALRKSEGRYRSLLDDVLDKSSVGVCILDGEFRVAWANRAFESYLGQERRETIGLPARRVVRERLAPVFEDPDAFAEKVLATYDDNTYTEHFECHVLPSEGRFERWLEHWSQPIESGLYKGGRIEQFAEVTERHNAEQRLRQFVHIARNMQMGLLVYHLEDPEDDRSLRLRILNPEGERLLGISESDVIGTLIDDAFPMLREDDVPKLFADAALGGELRDVKNYEYGDDRVAKGGWAFRAFSLPERYVGVLFERLKNDPGPDA